MSYSLSDPYLLHPSRKIWSRPGYGGISYNDGDTIENRLLHIVECARDLTVLSTELRHHCTDWPSLYHLSSSRANILRPFAERLPGRSVLEIGAGCGAITRYLGECGSEVLALEGTLRRAEIARARTRDLDNVTLLAESFEHFSTDQRFDIVTLIGVLEYAHMFVGGPRPELAMLERARQLLKPDGMLVLAIENQLGLKYFAGAPEDHVGKASFGLENRYEPGGVRTYGREQLQHILHLAGFAAQRFFAPFPDYKLPVSILSEEGLLHPLFDAGALAAQSARRDPQLPPALSCQLDRVWPVIQTNSLTLDLSNSFLVCAKSDPGQWPDHDKLGWHFSTERRRQFCKITQFSATHDNNVNVSSCRAASGIAAEHTVGLLSNVLDPDTPLQAGELMSQHLADLVGRDGWSDTQLCDFFDSYFSALSPYVGLKLSRQDLGKQVLDGQFIDAIPQNLVQDGSGHFHLIDREWRWHHEVPARQLVFRALISLSTGITAFGQHEQRTFANRLDFIRGALEIIGQDMDDPTMEEMLASEAALQTLVTGIESDAKKLASTLTNWPYSPPSIWQLSLEQSASLSALRDQAAEQARQLEEIHVNLEQREALLAEQAHLLHERLQLIHEQQRLMLEQQATIANREQWIASVSNSWSWRLGGPLRLGARLLRHPRDTIVSLKSRLLASMVWRWRAITGKPASLCVCIHAYYPDLLSTMVERLSRSAAPMRVIVTTTEDKTDQVRSALSTLHCPFQIIPVENRGRDILPFLIAAQHTRRNELILKIHTKKSPHRSDGDAWREDMLSQLLDPAQIDRALTAFRHQPRLGMLAPDGHVLCVEKYMRYNEDWFHRLEPRLPRTPWALDNRVFSGGTMFYIRSAALKPILNLGLRPEDFEAEARQLDGTLAHALERLFGVGVAHAGYYVSNSSDPECPALAQSNDIHPL